MPRDILHNCHVCDGKIERSGGEHVPPQSTGNSGNLTAYYLKVIDNIGKVESKSDTSYQNGFKIASLCVTCDNTFGANYVMSYKDFIDKIDRPHILADEYGRNIIYLENINPHNIIRQICSMFLSCNPYSPSGHMQHLKEFVSIMDSKPPKEFPYIYLYKTCSSHRKITPFGCVLEPTFKRSVTGSEISCPPLGIVITYKKSPIFSYMTEISNWNKYPSNKNITTHICLPQLEVDRSETIPFHFQDVVNPKNPCDFFKKNGGIFMLHVPKHEDTPDSLLPMQLGVIIDEGKENLEERKIKQQIMYDNIGLISLDSNIIKPPSGEDVETGRVIQEIFLKALRR